MEIHPCIGTEVDVARAASRRRRIREEVRPGTKKQFLSTTGLWRHCFRAQPVEMDDRIFQKNVVPRTHMIHRDIDVAVLPFDVDWPPVRTIFWVREVITEIWRSLFQ